MSVLGTMTCIPCAMTVAIVNKVVFIVRSISHVFTYLQTQIVDMMHFLEVQKQTKMEKGKKKKEREKS